MPNSAEISIIIVCFNEERYMGKCLESLFNQTAKDYELIVVNDYSGDRTLSKIHKFIDSRAKIINNPRNLGIAASRNIGLAAAKGRIVFFIDADCIAEKHWAEEGLRAFERNSLAVGVEGKTFYESRDYRHDFRDKSNYLHDTKGEFYATCNIAYLREAIQRAKGFDVVHCNYLLEDRELGLRIRKGADIVFCKEMIVFHQKKPKTVKSILREAKGQRARVYLFKEYNDKVFITRLFGINFLFIGDYIKLFLFPVLLLKYVFRKQIKSARDLYIFTILKFTSLIYKRIWIWRAALNERILVL